MQAKQKSTEYKVERCSEKKPIPILTIGIKCV